MDLGRVLQWLPDPHQYEPKALLVEDREVPEGPGPKASCCPASSSRRQLWPRDGTGAARPHNKDALHNAAPPCAPGLPGHPPQGPLATVPQAGSLHSLAPASPSPCPGCLPPSTCLWDPGLSPSSPHTSPLVPGEPSHPPSSVPAQRGKRSHPGSDACQGLAPACLQLPGLISPQVLSQGTFCDFGHVQHGTTSHATPDAQVWRKTRLQLHLV